MQKRIKNKAASGRGKKGDPFLLLGIALVLLFLVFTFLVQRVDLLPIGPLGSQVGFSRVNTYFLQKLPYQKRWDSFTGMVGNLPLLMIPFWSFVGLGQWRERKSLRRVDGPLYILALFYLLLLGIYLFFETWIVNYRPVLLGEGLEASYPSSHSLMAIFVLGSGCFLIGRYASPRGSRIFTVCSLLLMAFIVLGRFTCGVHWFTDILAGSLLGLGLVFLYVGIVREGGKKKTGERK